MGECVDLEGEWWKGKKWEEDEGRGKEGGGLIYGVENLDGLGVRGGIVDVEGKIGGFSLGMGMKEERLGVDVEKGDRGIEGGYGMIN